MIITEIRTVDEFEKLEKTWNDLLDNAEFPTVFQTWEWMFIWWKHFHEDKKLRLLVVNGENNKLLGIAPLYVTEKRYGLLCLKTLEFLGYGEKKNSEYLNFIVHKDYKKAVTEAIIDCLLEKKDWELLHLTNLCEGGILEEVLSIKCQNLRYTVHMENNFSCPFIELPETMEMYLQTIKSKQRGRLRNERNSLYKRYNVEIVLWHAGDKNLEKGMDLLLNLHRKRFGEQSSFYYKRNKSFHVDVAAVFRDKEIFRLYFMEINGEIACATYCFKFNNSLLFYQTGYDPKWMSVSALKILIYNVIENAIQERLKEFDFGRGMEQYKLEWTKSYRKTKDITLFKKNYHWWIFAAQKSLYKAGKKMLIKVFKPDAKQRNQ